MAEDENEFEKGLTRLNALMGEHWTWNCTQARKPHTDEFGVQIERDETYYRRSSGVAFHESQALSESSIRQVIEVLFRGHTLARRIADQIETDRQARIRSQMW